MGGADRQRAARGRLGGDHPEGLRERARHDQRLARRAAARRAPRARGARSNTTRSPSARAASQVALALGAREAVEEREQMAQRVRGRGRLSSALPGRAISRAPARGRPRCSAAQQALEPVAVGAEADDHQARPRHALEHQRPGREQQVDALADDQLADERDQPVARPGPAARAPPPPRRASRANALACSCPAGAPLQRRRRAASAPHARRRRRRLARREALRRRRPAGRAACARAAAPRRAPATGSRPCGASRRAPRARPRAPRARAPESARAAA